MGGGVSQGAPGAASREASSPPARPRSSERGGSVSGRLSGVRKCASVSSAPSGAGEGEVARSLPRLPLSAHHSMLCEVVSRESLRLSAPILIPPMFPDLRIEEQGRNTEPALGLTALVTAPVVLALALLTACGQAVESVGGGPCLDRCPSASGHDLIGRCLWTIPIASRSLSLSGRRSQSSDRYQSRRDRSRRDRSRSSDRYRSRRQLS